MLDLLREFGHWWAEFLLRHPLGTGLWMAGFFCGWVFQHAVKVRYPNFDQRPEWARWVVIFADCLTTDFTGVLNNVFKRFPFPGGLKG